MLRGARAGAARDPLSPPCRLISERVQLTVTVRLVERKANMDGKTVRLKRPLRGRIMFGDKEGPEIDLPPGEFELVEIDAKERGSSVTISVDVVLDAEALGLTGKDIEVVG